MSATAHHFSYLLRIWQDSQAIDSTWRASLQSINGGETLGFRNLEDLCAYLRRRTETREIDDGGETTVPE